MEDCEIIDLYFKRSESAIKETADKYGGYLKTVAWHILNSREDSEEVVDDTYLRAWKAIPPTRPKIFKHFLTRIVRNLSFDRLSYYSAEKRNAETESLFDELEACLPDRNGTVEDVLERKELSRLLNSFLGELQPMERCVFLSRYYYAHTLKEVAEEYTLSEGKVKYMLSSVRKTLRKKLAKEGIAE